MPADIQNTRKLTGLLPGPLLFFILLVLPQPADMPQGSMQVAAVAILMATYWMSEAIPIAATALIPIVLFPLLNVMPTSKVTLSYGNHLIFLFMGGFLIAVTIEKWQLHKRIALRTILLVGVSALANGFASSGLTEWIAHQLIALQRMDLILIVFMIVLLVIFLTEITSNTATASLLLPVTGAFAVALHSHPLNLMVAVALSASFAFMLPVATPPNAIVFSSRQITIPQMARAGFALNIIGSILITLFVIFYLPRIFITGG